MSLYTQLMDYVHQRDPEMCKRIEQEYTSHSSELRDLNAYFRLVLTQAPVSTLNERECLIDGLDPDRWLEYFKSTVFPTLKKFGLPH